MSQAASSGASGPAALSAARAFFADEDTARRAVSLPAPEKGRRIFQLAEAEVPPDDRPPRAELSADLLALLGIAAAYVDRKAKGQGEPSLRYSITLWEQVLSHLPLMGPGKFERRTETRDVRGTRLPDDLLAAGLGAGGRPLLPTRTFNRYLARQQAGVRTGIARNADGFAVITVRMIVDQVAPGSPASVLSAGFAATFSDYGARQLPSSARKGSKLQAETQFTLEVRSATMLFDYEQLQDPATRAAFEEFLRTTPQEDVQASPNFFDGLIPGGR